MEFEPIDLFFAEALLRPFEGQYQGQAVDVLALLFAAAREGSSSIVIEGMEDVLPQKLFESAVHREGKRYYLMRNWECEQRFLENFRRLQAVKPDIEVAAMLLEEDLSAEQKNAVQTAFKQTLTLITGGPGSGKTRTAGYIMKRFCASANLSFGFKPKTQVTKAKVACAAFTGKAATLLGKVAQQFEVELTHCTTLHALLSNTVLDIDLFIVDEASMIDAELMAKLFSKIRSGARIVLLGDKDQLPPIGTGNLFMMMMQLTSCCELTHCFRSDLKEILHLSARVKNGEMIPLQLLLDEHMLLQKIEQKFEMEKEKSLEEFFELQNRFRVLSALRMGRLGVDEINWKMRERAKYIARRLQWERALFPIMIRVNDKATGLVNGSSGILVEEMGKETMAYFENGISLKAVLLPDYEWAYCSSIHKSQGSEYDEVMVIFPHNAKRYFGREILYTAITRARKKVEVYGNEDVIREILGRVTNC